VSCMLIWEKKKGSYYSYRVFSESWDSIHLSLVIARLEWIPSCHFSYESFIFVLSMFLGYVDRLPVITERVSKLRFAV
jgi:hypothetical protein